MSAENKNTSEAPKKNLLQIIFGKRNGDQTREKEGLDTSNIRAKKTISAEAQRGLKEVNQSYAAKRSYELVGKQGVKKAQEKLKKMGYLNGGVDGAYGADTFQAVVRFQTRLKTLKTDGIIGPNTLTSLSGETVRGDTLTKINENSNIDYTKAKQYLQKYSPAQRVKLAKVLKVKNNYNALIDGIALFQKVSGVHVDGILGPVTLKAIEDSKNLSYHTPMTEAEVRKMNKEMERSEKLTGVERLSGRWKTIYKEFFLKLNGREKKEVLSGKYPVALADSRSQRLIYIHKGKVQKEVPAIFGYAGTAAGSLNKKGATPTKVVFNFNGANIPRDTYGRAANNPAKSPTVLGAAIISPEGAAGGGKWFHGVSDARMAKMKNNTAGCVGMKVQDARLIASQVRKCGKGFGYVS